MKTLYNPWDIVLCPFQFTNGQWSKHRPVVILFQDRNDYLVAAISTKLEQWGSFDLILNPWTENGLRDKSIIRLSKLFTFSEDIFVRKLWVVNVWYREILRENMLNFVHSW